MKDSSAPLRVAAIIFVLVGVIGLGFMIWIATWARDGADFVTPLLPGTRFKPEILARLGEIGGGALGLGLALFIVERIVAARAERLAATPEADRPVRRAQTPVQAALTVGLSLLIGGVGVIGYKWYAYVTNTASPYDEVGIDLNAMAPGPVNAWGCARLRATFGTKAAPPYGCAGPEGGWK